MSAEKTVRAAKRLARGGNINEAIALCETYLAKFPKNPRIRKQLSALRTKAQSQNELPAAQQNALRQKFHQGAYEALIPNISKLLMIYAESYFLWNLLGHCHLRRDAVDQAENALLRAMQINSKAASAFVGLGDVCKARQDYEHATAYYMKALENQPDNLTALNNLGTMLSVTGQYEEAAKVLGKAHDLAPDNHIIHHNLSAAYRELNCLEVAENWLHKALTINPGFADGRYNLGLLQALRGDRVAAVATYETLLSHAPDHAPARIEKLHQMAHLCDWRWVDEFAQLDPDFGCTGLAPPPFPFLAMEDHPERQRARSAYYAAQNLSPPCPKLPATAKSANARPRVGYFSADFHDHATLHLMGGLFEHHDPNKVEVLAYSFGPQACDAARARLLAGVGQFHEVGHLPASDIAALAREHGLDIAVDLKGYTGDNRAEIFHHRAAPIQISWLGYPGSMGTEALDYVIADPVVLPAPYRSEFREKVIYMPDSYQVNDDQREIADHPFTRAECDLPVQGFVFCCFNNSYKITPAEFDIWMRLLVQCDGSVLWLLNCNETAVQNLRRAAETRGVSGARLIFAPRLPAAQHLARHGLADLFLDTFACNAHTTASDALWAGVPVLTLAGKQFAARVAASLLHAVGLPELVTSTPEEYESLALALAQDPARLACLRDKLAFNKASLPLFNTREFTRNLETAFLRAYGAMQAGDPVQDIHINAPAHADPPLWASHDPHTSTPWLNGSHLTA